MLPVDPNVGSNVVTNRAPGPDVVMRITDDGGRDTGEVTIGDPLLMKFEIEPGTAFDFFVTDVQAYSGKNEFLELTDSQG